MPWRRTHSTEATLVWRIASKSTRASTVLKSRSSASGISRGGAILSRVWICRQTAISSADSRAASASASASDSPRPALHSAASSSVISSSSAQSGSANSLTNARSPSIASPAQYCPARLRMFLSGSRYATNVLRGRVSLGWAICFGASLFVVIYVSVCW